MRVVKSSGYDPRAFDEHMAKVAAFKVVPAAAEVAGAVRQMARAKWSWEEDAQNIGKHNPFDVDGNFVAYAGSVAMELDQRFDEWQRSGMAAAKAEFEIDLNDRINSTGTEQKAHNQHTGVVFRINLSSMKQTNVKSGFSRNVKRLVISEAVEVTASTQLTSAADGDAAASAPNAQEGIVRTEDGARQAELVEKIKKEMGITTMRGDAEAAIKEAAHQLGLTVAQDQTFADLLAQVASSLFGASQADAASTQPASASPPKLAGQLSSASKLQMQKALGAKGNKPAEIAGDDFLVCYPGQLLQTSKTRPDGWAFGTVTYDPKPNRPPVGVDRVSVSSGWFPLAATDLPTADQMAELQKLLGGTDGAADTLKTPSTWTPVKDPLTPELVKVEANSAEGQKVKAAFMQTLPPNIKVISIQRIQNHPMWQSYAVKRQTVLMRETKGAATDIKTVSRMERVWLFHGTQEDTVPKIVGMGFNRSFCGLNATRFGKGVYFARDASYSSSTTYSRPNHNGEQHMFLCRLTVGEYCLGKNNQIAPDVRKGNILYDTTVNDMANPAIYVAYHDAQAYPEYLVKFKQ